MAGLQQVYGRSVFERLGLFDEHGDDAGGHEVGHGAGEHGAEA
jgi:hypothetical protein